MLRFGETDRTRSGWVRRTQCSRARMPQVPPTYPLVCVSQGGRDGLVLQGDSLLGLDHHCRQHFLNFFPLPLGQGSFGPTLRVVEVEAVGSVVEILTPSFFMIS